jgi:hypothetical protein
MAILPSSLLGQIRYYEIINGDSVVLFYNDELSLVERRCAYYLRFTRIDQQGNFDGDFIHTWADTLIASTGTYRHGLKDGYFEFYHNDGLLMARGNYHNNNPVGTWEFFHPSGLPERTLEIVNQDTLVIRYVDAKGNVLVDNGNGKFKGLAYRTLNGFNVIAEGRIKDERPDGVWFNTAPYCVEKYKDGKFIKGNYPTTPVKYWPGHPVLNTFFPHFDTESTESFRTAICSDAALDQYITRRTNLDEKYTFNSAKLVAEIRSKIGEIVERDLQSDSIRAHYSVDRINIATIAFTLDEHGRPKDVHLLSQWGKQFLDDLGNLLAQKATFKPKPGFYYFHLQLYCDGKFRYIYRFHFSKSKTPERKVLN